MAAGDYVPSNHWHTSQGRWYMLDHRWTLLTWSLFVVKNADELSRGWTSWSWTQINIRGCVANQKLHSSFLVAGRVCRIWVARHRRWTSKDHPSTDLFLEVLKWNDFSIEPQSCFEGLCVFDVNNRCAVVLPFHFRSIDNEKYTITTKETRLKSTDIAFLMSGKLFSVSFKSYMTWMTLIPRM